MSLKISGTSQEMNYNPTLFQQGTDNTSQHYYSKQRHRFLYDYLGDKISLYSKTNKVTPQCAIVFK